MGQVHGHEDIGGAGRATGHALARRGRRTGEYDRLREDVEEGADWERLLRGARGGRDLSAREREAVRGEALRALGTDVADLMCPASGGSSPRGHRVVDAQIDGAVLLRVECMDREWSRRDYLALSRCLSVCWGPVTDLDLYQLHEYRRSAVLAMAEALRVTRCPIGDLGIVCPGWTRMKPVFDALKVTPCPLRRLYMDGLNGRQLRSLFSCLGETRCPVEELILWTCHALDLRGLAQALLETRCPLWYLKLVDCRVRNARHLLEAMGSAECPLESLSMNMPPNRGAVVPLLTDVLRVRGCRLRRLVLYDTSKRGVLRRGDISALAEALKVTRCPLRDLYLNSRSMTAAGFEALAEALKVTRCPLQSLGLVLEGMTATGVEALAEALKVTRCPLQSLVLALEGMTAAGVVAVAEALKVTRCPLGRLYMPYVERSDTAAVALAEALKVTRCPLYTLHLYHVTDIGATALAEALRVTECPLMELKLQTEGISVAGMSALAEAIKVTSCPLSTLEIFRVSDGISSAAAPMLLDMLEETSCPLDGHVHMGYNVADEAVRAWRDALKKRSQRFRRRLRLILYFFVSKLQSGQRSWSADARRLGFVSWRGSWSG